MIGLLTSLVAWFLVIILAAMLFQARKKQKDLEMLHLTIQLEDAEEDAKLRRAHKVTISALQGQLTNLQYVIRGTDEATEEVSRDMCEENDEEYEMPKPLEGAVEFAVEVDCLRQTLSAIYYDLDDERILDPDIEFYQNWVTSVVRQVTSWNERRRDFEQLEDVMARLHVLSEKLNFVHGVTEWCPPLLESFEVESPQDLLNEVVLLRHFLKVMLSSKFANPAKQATQFTLEVESLERRYSRLHDPLSKTSVAHLAPYDTDHLDHFLSQN